MDGRALSGTGSKVAQYLGEFVASSRGRGVNGEIIEYRERTEHH
jgi:hypothetical protein